jgi:hypothetical protein
VSYGSTSNGREIDLLSGELMAGIVTDHRDVQSAFSAAGTCLGKIFVKIKTYTII